MATRRWILLLLSVAMISGLAGCGGSSTNVQNQPAPPASSVSIAFQPAPPATVSQIAIAPITAVVSNDSTNAGVDWVLLCQSTGNCGTLSPLHTASGKAATYTPSLTPSGNIQPVTIEAFATADHTKNVVASINVTGFAGMLKGTYVFETRGLDANGSYQLAGVIVLDGNGNITSGEQTHNDPLLSVSDTIIKGSYTIGQDGRGALTLVTNDPNIGQQGTEYLALVLLSSSHAYLATLDPTNSTLLPSNETSSGSLDLQSSTTVPTGGYAFVVNGVDISNKSMAMGGVLNIDSPNNISGAGSVADQDDAGIVTPGAALSGTLTKPDALGSLKFNLTTGFAAALQFTGYIVDATHIKLIESDNAGSGAGFGTTAGVAIGQGAATGTFTNNKSFAGAYVFDILGQDPNGVPTSLASVGQFSADASGNLNSGYDDEEMIAFGLEISDSFTGSYTLDPSGTGRVDSIITFATNGPGPELIFYLTGNGNPPLLLDADDNSSSSGVGSTGIGVGQPQAAPPFSFNGRYGLMFAQELNSNESENDATGQIVVNGTLDTLTGAIDTDENFVPGPNTPVSGTFVAIPSNGRFTGTLNNSFFPNTNPTVPNTIAVAFYLVNPGYGFFIETDSSTSGELTLGSFATRTPVCSACP
ncbi:MAG TPA: hypothetical protein VFF64_08255 [Candidatus Eremiobacteraceae bacterium]|nr:hypothetical protein [Candidatus Eremiobacteraceae bacterium]